MRVIVNDVIKKVQQLLCSKLGTGGIFTFNKFTAFLIFKKRAIIIMANCDSVVCIRPI